MKYLFMFLISFQALADVTPEQQEAGDAVCDAANNAFHIEDLIEKQEQVEKISGVRHMQDRRQLAEQFLSYAQDLKRAMDNPEAAWLLKPAFISDACTHLDKSLEKGFIKRVEGLKK